MSGDEVRVDPVDLRAKASQIEAISWGNNPVEMPAMPADALSTARTAVDNLNANATSLAEHQEYGKKQGQRLAETLRLVADAYATVDHNAMENINNTIPGAAPAPPAPVTPGANAVPAPTAPQPLPIQRGMESGDYMEVMAAQGALLTGDQAASLQAAATTWAQNGATLATAAEGFELSSVNWEGEAADAAYRSFNDYQAFLVELSGAWARLASEAQRVAAAHISAVGNHTPLAQQYAQLEAQLPAAIANGGSAARVIQLKMEELQKESEELRHQYAREAQPDEVNPPEPPRNTGAPPIPVRSNGDPRGAAGTSEQQGGSSGEQQPSNGAAGGAPQSMPQDGPMSPMSAAEQASQAGQQGGQQGGGSPGGGQPGGGSPGGGSPGGGQPGGGMPGGPKGDTKFPTDPSLRPAAAGGGGSGGGASGGGGGGGVPGAPLQPAVGAETVAPTPVVGPVIPAAAAGGAAGGGMAGGGMGGMAPIMGAGQGGGTGEKKRNPQLSQDEELYTEERPWTEAVIGNRVRRRGGPDDTKKESQ
ncbi:MAG: ESX-1 secretion-associated protein [Mycobacterium sp.]|nr:ESX-1 secretion-associated protein [Mycobacterium sp.]